MTSKVTYKGELRTKAKHLRSGKTIITDAPIDNHGKGEAFSPTDLCATSLASCMFSVMGIKCNQLGLDMKGSKAEVTKVMASDPRRISEIHLKLKMKGTFTDKEKKILHNTAATCPVFYSLHPDIKIELAVEWKD